MVRDLHEIFLNLNLLQSLLKLDRPIGIPPPPFFVDGDRP